MSQSRNLDMKELDYGSPRTENDDSMTYTLGKRATESIQFVLPTSTISLGGTYSASWVALKEIDPHIRLHLDCGCSFGSVGTRTETFDGLTVYWTSL